MNEYLKTRSQIDESTNWLKENGFVTHPISCKDWELKKITEQLTDGDLLDMGADGSFVLHNAIKKGTKGRKAGIDLAEVTGDNKAEGVEYYRGNLMRTDFGDEEFDMVVCCSVLEHEVDFKKFAEEVSRVLRPGGKAIVSFDYWPDKVNTDGLLLYGLKWNILSDGDVIDLVEACHNCDLEVTANIDWSTGDAVINPQYCSPFPGISYTFGILKFIKCS